MKKSILLLILIISTNLAFSQVRDLKQYNLYLGEGDDLVKVENYFDAYEKYRKAEYWAGNDQNRKNIAGDKMDFCITKIKRQQVIADSLLIVAENEKKKVEEEKAKAEIEKIRSDSLKVVAINANATNDKIISTMYWVGDNLTITMDEYNRYGFIDKKGNIVIEPIYGDLIDLNYYGNGLALMKNKINDYGRIDKKGKFLINGYGKEYGYTRKARKIDNEVTALDLTPKVYLYRLFKPSFKKIAKCNELEVLLFPACKITNIPPEIGDLKNLTKLELSWNKLTTLPKEIGELQQLQKLFLYYNPLTELPLEIAKLPNLKVLYLENLELDKEKFTEFIKACPKKVLLSEESWWNDENKNNAYLGIYIDKIEPEWKNLPNVEVIH